MKLADLYKKLTPEQRADLAERAGISDGYLGQLASGWVRPNRGARVCPSVALMARLAMADKRLKVADMVAEFSEPAKVA